MTNQPIYGKKPEETAPDPVEKVRLDDKISDLTVRTAKGLERYWKLLAGAALGLLVLVAIFQAVEALGTSRRDAAEARLFELTGKVSEDQELDLAAIETYLTSDLRGADNEQAAYQRVVQLLLDRAATLERKDASPISFPGMPAPEERTDAQKAADADKRQRYLATAAKLAEEASSRFSDDESMLGWATGVKKRIESTQDKSWLPAEHKFQIKPPTAVPPQGE